MEVFDGLEIFDIEELFFNGIVHRFDIAVMTPCFWGDSFVDGLEALNDLFKSIPCAIISIAADEL